MAENAPKTPGRPFARGNPGGPGRPKVPDEFKAKCRKATNDLVFNAWKEEVETRGEHWPKAAEMLAAYGHGKPTQPVSGEDGGPLQVVIRMVDDDG